MKTCLLPAAEPGGVWCPATTSHSWEPGASQMTVRGQGLWTEGSWRGTPGWEEPPTPCAAPHPWKKYDGNILSSVSVRIGSASHVAWGPGQRRAAWGPAGEAGWAGQHPRTWGGLALIDSCGWSS